MKQRTSPLDLVLLLVLCVIGIFLGKTQTNARTEGRVDSVTALVQTLVSPVSGTSGNMVRGGGDFFSGIFSARRLADENQRLRAIATQVELYNAQVERLETEIDRLRSLQKFGPLPGKTRVRADVVGFSPYENRLTLNVGTKQGIEAGMPVQAPDGLVGTVQAVETDRCQVLLLTSASLTIGAIDIDRNPPPAGLLRGENSNTMNVTFQDPKAPVEVGDRVVTSGFSTRIPRGIIIGRVIALEQDEEFGSLRAKVYPAVSVGSLREVFVLR